MYFSSSDGVQKPSSFALLRYAPLRCFPSRQLGFSLLEVLCVVLILTTLAGVAWQSSLMSSLIDHPYDQVKKAQKSLTRGLLLARQYAVQSQQTVLLCGGIDEEGSVSACQGNWSQGWSIQQAGKAKTQQPFSTAIVVRWSGFPVKKHFIRFQANGHTGYQNGTFIVCAGQWQGRITLNQSGRFYVSRLQKGSDVVGGFAC
ncbi:prepilin-type N-terminal cleavage/methylation domain-containing protein [Marinomonas agarivorans]|nr:prepilin-type N-terminal cleavage/methylation domain-containing protein [Marinomonas agarivorans]